jgi:hypothetical protein
VAVEKLLPEKFAKIKLRQDALQTTFLFFLDIFYPLNFGYFEENGVFQQPLSISLVDPDKDGCDYYGLFAPCEYVSSETRARSITMSIAGPSGVVMVPTRRNPAFS